MAELVLRSAKLHRPTIFWTLAALLAGLLSLLAIVNRPLLPGDPAVSAALDRILVWHSMVPRAATAIVAGAALGLSGALLQRVLRNPIADPSTLGIASGAQLALTLAIVASPILDGVPREVLALAGGSAAAALVLALGWRRDLEPVVVVLAGMTISLIAAAISSAVILASGDYVLSLFIWGAGSLHQQSWDIPVSLAVRLALGAAAAILLLRPLALLGLDDAQARSLGLALPAMRLAIIMLAVWLAASVTAAVGIIGFVGLAAPAFARLSGAHGQARMLVVSMLLGGILLWLTDGIVQLWQPDGGERIPAGAATGLLGGLLLLWLLPRLKSGDRPLEGHNPLHRRTFTPWQMLSLLLLPVVLLGALDLMVGRDHGGWTIAVGQLMHELLPFRGSRLLSAITAGALLGAAGTLLQRLTGNPLASPEVLGVSAGAGVGLAVVLLGVAAPGAAMLLVGSSAGALVALLAILALGAWVGFGPERLLLAGTAVSATSLAVIAAVLATGTPQSFQLLVWMSGSTDRLTTGEAAMGLALAVLLLALLPFLRRWLDILPLGDPVGHALGMPVRAGRLLLAVLAALMTALAASIVGPLSLVGLIAPHMARLIGFVNGLAQTVAAICFGTSLMLAADWISRIVIFPYQIPVGLLVALLGGPYLIWLLQRGEAHRG